MTRREIGAVHFSFDLDIGGSAAFWTIKLCFPSPSSSSSSSSTNERTNERVGTCLLVLNEHRTSAIWVQRRLSLDSNSMEWVHILVLSSLQYFNSIICSDEAGEHENFKLTSSSLTSPSPGHLLNFCHFDGWALKWAPALASLCSSLRCDRMDIHVSFGNEKANSPSRPLGRSVWTEVKKELINKLNSFFVFQFKTALHSRGESWDHDKHRDR